MAKKKGQVPNPSDSQILPFHWISQIVLEGKPSTGPPFAPRWTGSHCHNCCIFRIYESLKKRKVDLLQVKTKRTLALLAERQRILLYIYIYSFGQTTIIHPPEIRRHASVFYGCFCDTSCDSFSFTYRLLLRRIFVLNCHISFYGFLLSLPYPPPPPPPPSPPPPHIHHSLVYTSH